MTKKAIIDLDLASWAGTLKYVPGRQLPRHDKALLEQTIATSFLTHLAQREGSAIENVQSNPSDPPDVTFTCDGQVHGMELSELIPENRFEKDAIIRTLRRDIISRLILNDNTAGFVVTVFFLNDYSTKLRPGRIGSVLANALTEYFNRRDPDARTIQVPEQIQDVVARISVFRENMAGDPRLEDDREPLILFGAQSTMLVPEDDCPAMVESRLSRKALHDLDCPTWLLLWSNHHALSSLRDELDKSIGCYLRSHKVSYERVFHWHAFNGSGVTEFPIIFRENPRQ